MNNIIQFPERKNSGWEKIERCLNLVIDSSGLSKPESDELMLWAHDTWEKYPNEFSVSVAFPGGLLADQVQDLKQSIERAIKYLLSRAAEQKLDLFFELFKAKLKEFQNETS